MTETRADSERSRAHSHDAATISRGCVRKCVPDRRGRAGRGDLDVPCECVPSAVSRATPFDPPAARVSCAIPVHSPACAFLPTWWATYIPGARFPPLQPPDSWPHPAPAPRLRRDGARAGGPPVPASCEVALERWFVGGYNPLCLPRRESDSWALPPSSGGVATSPRALWRGASRWSAPDRTADDPAQ